MKIGPEFRGIPYAYWFSKIKLRTNQRVVDTDFLKDIFMREICCDDNKARKGGNKKGIPKRFMYAMINDMRNLSFEPKKVVDFNPLLKKINYRYEVSSSQEYKRILEQPFPF